MPLNRLALRAAAVSLTLLATLTLLTSSASARKCGKEGKRPCTVLERVPSCDKGLFENFKTKRCERKKKAKPIIKAKPKPRRVICGALNQRPCTVLERVPSCNKGLVENFRLKRCVKPVKKALNCGKLNQRPCKVTERIPSCNKGLVEHFKKKRCVQPGKVGAKVKAKFDRFAGDFVNKNRRLAKELTRFGQGLMNGPTAKYFKNGGFKRDVEKSRVANIVRNIDISAIRKSLKTFRSAYLPKTIMIGVVIEGGVGMGGTVELGIAFDISPQGGNAVLYRTFGVTMGLITGGSGSISVGLAWVRPPKLVGELRGLSFGAGKSVFQGASVGGSLGFWFQPLANQLGGIGFDPRRFAGINIAVSIGATVLPVDFRGTAALTQVLTKRGVWRADACGANGIRPCHVIERVPSCNRGLREDFARHLCVR